MPPTAGARVEAVEPTTIVVEAEAYRVIPAGFTGDVDERIVTDRHELWGALDEIEVVRHTGPYFRVRQLGISRN